MCSDLEQKCFITLGKGAQGKAESEFQSFSLVNQENLGKAGGLLSEHRDASPSLRSTDILHLTMLDLGREGCCCSVFSALSATLRNPSPSCGHDEVHSLLKYLHCRNSDSRKFCLSAQINLLISKITKGMLL